ncbi:MAG: ribosomal protein L7/L12 [Candidatus Heimdallarchaeota archaeon]
MKIKELKYFLNSLSTDFNEHKISIKVDSQQYDVRDLKLFKDRFILTAEEHFKETIFDEVDSTLTCTNWDRNFKLQMVKALKGVTKLGLKEAKDIIDDDQAFVVATGKMKSEYLNIIKKFPEHAIFDID